MVAEPCEEEAEEMEQINMPPSLFETISIKCSDDDSGVQYHYRHSQLIVVAPPQTAWSVAALTASTSST
jgi:hypothetical protein